MNLAAKEMFFCPWRKIDFKMQQRERGIGYGVSYDSWQRFFKLGNCLLFFTGRNVIWETIQQFASI